MNSVENLPDRAPDAITVGQDLSNSAIPVGTMGVVQLSGWTKAAFARHHQAAQGGERTATVAEGSGHDNTQAYPGH